MKIKVYKSELGEYVEMDVIAQYKYLGKSYGVESLTNGKIYDCVGYDGSMARIVDDSGEDYLYNLNEFKLVSDNNMNELQQKEDELYYYLLVQYEDYPSYREYNYISDDTSVEVGDRVLVDMAGSLAIAEVLETGFFNRFDAPFPVEKTKRIIKKVDENFDLIDFEFKDENGDVVAVGATVSTLFETEARKICLSKEKLAVVDLESHAPVLESLERRLRTNSPLVVVEKRRVRPSMTDGVGHVNNTHYGDFVYDAMTDCERERLGELKRIDVWFNYELLVGDEFEIIKCCENDDVICFSGRRLGAEKNSFDVKLTFSTGNMQ